MLSFRGYLPTLLPKIFLCHPFRKTNTAGDVSVIAQHKETPWLTVHKLVCTLMAELLVNIIFLEVHDDRMKANEYKL